MYLFLIAISFLGSIAFSLLLRRMERPAARETQLKRLAELQENRLENLAGRHIQSIQDAILDYDMLLRQSHSVREELGQGLEEYRASMAEVRKERELIDDISNELAEIAGSARSVGDQVERLDRGLERLSLAENEMSEIHERLEDLALTVDKRGQESEATLADVISRLIRETEERTRSLTENARSSFQILQDEYKELETRLDDQSRDSEILGERVGSIANRFEEKWLSETNRIEERLGAAERKFTDRLSTMEDGLAGLRNNAVESLQGEIKRMRDDLEDFNLEAVSRRDEILNETRRMAEGMQDQVKAFQESYLSAENRLIKDAEHYNRQLLQKHEAFENQWNESQTHLLRTFEERAAELEEQMGGLQNQEHDRLADEAARLREDFKELAGDAQERIERQVNQGQERLREFQREEERDLQNARDELSGLRDNLNMLGHEMKASLRSEMEHSIALIKDARKTEEEQFIRGRAELEGFRQELNERIDRVDEQFREVSRIRAKLEEYGDKLRDELSEISTAQENYFRKKSEEMLGEQGEVLANLKEKFRHEVEGRIDELEGNVGEAAEHVEDRLREFEKNRKNLDAEVERFRSELDKRQAGLHGEQQMLHEELRSTARHFQEELESQAEDLRGEQEQIREHMDGLLARAEMELDKRLQRGFESRMAEYEESVKEIQRIKDRVEEHVERVRKDILEARDGSVEQLEKRAAKFLDEQDAKLARLSEDIDEKISEQLMALADQGQLQLAELEKRTHKTIEASVERLEGDLEAAGRQFHQLRQDIAAEMEQARALKDEVIGEIERDGLRLQKFREQLEMVDTAEDLVNRLDETLEILTGRLDLAREENAKLDEYVRNFEEVRVNRKELETELRMLEGQRERLTQAEQYFHDVEKQLEELHVRMSDIDRAEDLAGKIEKRITQFNEFKESFEQLRRVGRSS